MIRIFSKTASAAFRYLLSKKNFDKDEDTCNACVKPLEKVVKIKPHIYIMLKNNAKYRVFTDLHCSYADFIFRREPITGISKKISDEKLDIHLNALLNYNCLLSYDIKESL